MKKVMVYIAGPYTHPDPVENTHNVMKAADLLIKAGCIPILPHLSLLWHLVNPRPVEFWYEYDLAILERCDILYRLPGASSGADKEVAFAREKNIPICFTIEDVIKEAITITVRPIDPRLQI